MNQKSHRVEGSEFFAVLVALAGPFALLGTGPGHPGFALCENFCLAVLPDSGLASRRCSVLRRDLSPGLDRKKSGAILHHCSSGV